MRAVRKSSTLPLLAALALAGAAAPPCVSAQDAVVRAVLFYSPTCPHCHQVMTEDLPPLAERYGDRLQIVGVDVSTPRGQTLLRATVDYFGIPTAEAGVPLLVAGEEYMMGSLEIPERLPGIIERALAEEGVDWPHVGAIRRALAANGLLQESTEPGADPEAPPPTVTADSATSEPTAEGDPADVQTDAATEGADADSAVSAEAAPPATDSSSDAVAEPTGGTGPAATPPPPTVDPRVERPRADPSPGRVDTAATEAAEAVAPPGAESEPATEAPRGITGSLTPEAVDGGAGGIVARLLRDPLGNAVAILVLLGLVGALAVSFRMAGMARAPGDARPAVPPWLVPSLTVVGMGVAAYLSFVEVTGQSAVCGPVGDCNAVQQSPYAHLFGILPVGVLGLVGYAAILAAWGLERGGPRVARRPTLRLRWAMAFGATAFSVYLTFLEPFVIGATCMWCITSSVVVALLLLATTLELRASAEA